MPLTEVQARVLRLLAAGRSPESYVAGATVLHRSPDSPRYSQDVDFFHDVAESVALCAEADATSLRSAGATVEWTLRTPTFYRAVATVDGKRLRLEWAQHSAYRFFPVQPDGTCGYRLHDADAAVNKLLALAGRQEVRDFVDTLYLNAATLSLGALAWAACGKDPGYTPSFLLDQAARHVSYTQEDLNRLDLHFPLLITDLKRQWLAAEDAARRLITSLPEGDLGCLYLSSDGDLVDPDPSDSRFAALRRHFGSVRGAWASVSELDGPVGR